MAKYTVVRETGGFAGSSDSILGRSGLECLDVCGLRGGGGVAAVFQLSLAEFLRVIAQLISAQLQFTVQCVVFLTSCTQAQR